MTGNWAQSPTLRVLGIDPGFGDTGASVLEQELGGKTRVLDLETISTAKAGKKSRHAMRVSDDDKRRLSEIMRKVADLVERHDVHAVGIEVYEPYTQAGPPVPAGLPPEQRAAAMAKRQGRQSGWKTLMVYGVILGYCFTRGILVIPFRANDLKIKIAGKKGASKAQVRSALGKRIPGFTQRLGAVAKGNREHVGDATGHAYLTLVEMLEMRKIAGVRV